MAGDASKIAIRESGDVFIWDPAETYAPLTAVPDDIDEALGSDWRAAGLMLGDPGVGVSRQVERTDVNSWQQGRVRERVKNPKSDITFTLLEDNDVTADLVDEAKVPGVKNRYVAIEITYDDGRKKRKISKAPVGLFVATDDESQDVKGREVTGALQPVAGEYWTIQESA